jgi:hypothetical protein
VGGGEGTDGEGLEEEAVEVAYGWSSGAVALIARRVAEGPQRRRSRSASSLPVIPGIWRSARMTWGMEFADCSREIAASPEPADSAMYPAASSRRTRTSRLRASSSMTRT